MRLLARWSNPLAFPAFTAALLACSCGGGSASSNNPDAIGGKITATDFSVPAGKTVTVTSDLVVLASNSITVAGTLQLASGVNATLLTHGNLTLTGAVVSTASAGRAEARLSGNAGHATSPGGANSYVLFAAELTVDALGGSIDVSQGTSVDVFIVGHSIRFNSITAAAGQKGASADDVLRTGGSV